MIKFFPYTRPGNQALISMFKELNLSTILDLVSSEDKPTIGFLYRTMYEARKKMVKRFQRNKTKVKPYLKVLDHQWNSQLQKYLHLWVID